MATNIVLIRVGRKPNQLESKDLKLRNALSDPDITDEYKNKLLNELETIETNFQGIAVPIFPTAVGPKVSAIRALVGPARPKPSDWRKLSVEETRRFLIFLFGENPKKTGNGITVFREQGRWRISFKGIVEFHHELSNGRPLRPLSHAVKDRQRRCGALQ